MKGSLELDKKKMTECQGEDDDVLVQGNSDMTPDTTEKALYSLDDTVRQIRIAEHKLYQQRVNCAMLTVELSTLHDPLMREMFSMCVQGEEQVKQKIAQGIEAQKYLSQTLHTSMPQDTQQDLPQDINECVHEEQHEPHQEPKLPELHDTQSVSTNDAQRINASHTRSQNNDSLDLFELAISDGGIPSEGSSSTSFQKETPVCNPKEKQIEVIDAEAASARQSTTNGDVPMESMCTDFGLHNPSEDSANNEKESTPDQHYDEQTSGMIITLQPCHSGLSLGI